MNINIPTELHNRFKASTAAQGLEMTVVLLAFIEGYVAKHGPPPRRRRDGAHDARRPLHEGQHR